MNKTNAMIVCLCGSTRFREELAAARAEWTLNNWVVVGPEVMVRSDPAYSDLHDTETKHTLDALHFEKIALADRVHIVNPGGYIGESTRNEIEYAKRLDKLISYLVAPGDER